MRFLFWLAMVAIISLSGCGGGGLAPSDPPPPPPPPPPATWTISGMAEFFPATTAPSVGLATLNDDGSLSAIAYANPITMPAGITEKTPIAFTLKFQRNLLETGASYHLVSFNDKNGDGLFSQDELIGDWEYTLRPNTGGISVFDAFDTIPDWGVDATLCSGGQITIAAQYEE